MMRPFGPIRFAFRLAVVLLFVVRLAVSSPSINAASGENDDTAGTMNSSRAAEIVSWNVNEKELPLLNLHGERLKPGLDRSLAYGSDQFRFPILQALTYDEEHGRYLLPSLTAQSAASYFIEFAAIDVKNNYLSTDGSNLRLIDNDRTKTIRTSEGMNISFFAIATMSFAAR